MALMCLLCLQPSFQVAALEESTRNLVQSKNDIEGGMLEGEWVESTLWCTAWAPLHVDVPTKDLFVLLFYSASRRVAPSASACKMAHDPHHRGCQHVATWASFSCA